MAKTAVARSTELEPIDRLEEKLKLLVSMINQLKAEQAKAAAENGRLTQELGGAVRYDGSTSPVVVTYKSADTTA